VPAAVMAGDIFVLDIAGGEHASTRLRGARVVTT
jgi:hypothetical protein